MRMRRGSVSALRWGARRFEGRERTFVGIESVRAAEGHGLVAAGVAAGGAEDQGDFHLGEAFGDDFLPAGWVFAWGGELAEEKGLEALQLGGILAELGAHGAVDGGDAGAAPELVQERRVAVADDQLRGDGGEIRGEAEEPVPAAGE